MSACQYTQPSQTFHFSDSIWLLLMTTMCVVVCGSPCPIIWKLLSRRREAPESSYFRSDIDSQAAGGNPGCFLHRKGRGWKPYYLSLPQYQTTDSTVSNPSIMCGNGYFLIDMCNPFLMISRLTLILIGTWAYWHWYAWWERQWFCWCIPYYIIIVLSSC